MKNIPDVKTWIVKLNGKDEIQVKILAPTRFLAKLNFQHRYGWILGSCIKSISVER